MQTRQQRRSTASPWLWALIAVAGLALFATATPARADAPTITGLSPDSGPAAGGDTVTITGTNFDDVDESEVTVTFGGIPGTGVNVVSDTQLTVTTPPHAPGAVDVVVTADGASDPATFTYHPVITSLSASSGPASGGTSVVITGVGFTGASAVMFGSTAATFTVNNDTEIAAASPPGTAGATVQVRVTVNGVQSPTTGVANFTYNPLPTVTNVSPNTGSTAGGNPVVITGTGFTGAFQVAFGSVISPSITVNSATQITATAPPQAAGTVYVRVTTPNGTSADVAAAQYTYTTTGTAPAITNISPNVGPTAGGTVVEITGTNFTGATAVTFGTTAATSFEVNSSTSITAVAPALAAGTVFVRVITPAGTSADVAAAQYTASATIPVITSISPSSGPTAGGTTVTITGTGFTGTTAVSFGGTAATSFTVNSATQITATTPARSAGTVFVTVTATSGTSAPTTASRFTYGNLPAITALNPSTGPTSGGTTVVITGSGFTGATAVTFGGTAATSFTVNSDTQITAVSPARAAGTVHVRVTTPVGQSAEVDAARFTYGTGQTTVTYTLRFRWTLIAWLGEDGITVTQALAGTGGSTTNITGQVSAIYRWNATTQRWEANFPTGGNIPGANDFTTLSYGAGYFIAITTSGTVTWVVEAGP